MSAGFSSYNINPLNVYAIHPISIFVRDLIWLTAVHWLIVDSALLNHINSITTRTYLEISNVWTIAQMYQQHYSKDLICLYRYVHHCANIA